MYNVYILMDNVGSESALITVNISIIQSTNLCFAKHLFSNNNYSN